MRPTLFFAPALLTLAIAAPAWPDNPENLLRRHVSTLAGPELE